MSYEKIIKRTIAPLFALSLGLAACGSSESTEASAPAPEKTPAFSNTYYSGDIQVKATYTPTGMRILQYEDGQSNNDNGFSNGRYDIITTVISHCDGHDLLDQTIMNGGPSGVAGNDISRSPNHPACDDGRLTEDEFKIAG